MEVEGESGVGDFAPEIDGAKFRSLGEAPLPNPVRPTSDELVSGRLDSQWIEVQGVVRSAAERDGGLVLNLSSGAFECNVFVLSHPSFPPEIIDARVRIRGVFAGLYDSTSTRFIGFQILTPNWSNVQIVERPPQGLFSLPLRPIPLFLRLTPEGAFTHRVHVRGAVLMQELGRSVSIRDHGLALWVRTTQPLPLKVGDLIDAVGFPVIGDYMPVMRDAVIQRVGSGPVPEPIAESPEKLQAGVDNADLVRLSARLLNRTTRPGEEILELQAGGVTFRAELSIETKKSPLGSLRNGSLLQLTGVSLAEVDDKREPKGFRILLRSADDIVVLKRPSWWTGDRVAALVATLAGIILLIALWVTVLRRRVDERTETVRATLESTGDGILVVNSAGKIVTYNRQFAEMWAIPESILRSYDHKSAVKFVAPQLKDPDAFVNKIRQANTDHEAHIDDVLELQDGHIYERHSEPQLVKGKSVGRVWAFRDVTGHRRAAVALREATDRLNLALKSAQAGTWSWSPDQKILRWDNQVSALYGLEPDAWENNYYEHFTTSVHPDDRSAAAERMARSIREGLLFECEFRVTWPDGSIHVVANRGEVWRDQGGEAAGITGVAWDVTDRKHAEEALRLSEERYRELFENASDIVYTTDLDARMTSMNRVGQAIPRVFTGGDCAT